MKLRSYAPGFVNPYAGEGMAASTVPNYEVNFVSLVGEGLETRKFKGRMACKGCRISDVQHCDQHQLAARGSAVLHE